MLLVWYGVYMKIKSGRQALNRLMFIIQADLEYLINLLVNGAFLATLTTYLGMSDSTTGIISAFASLGCLFQLFSVFFKKVSVKRFVLILSIMNQFSFIMLYLIPLGGKSSLGSSVFVVFILMALLIYNIAHPKKIDWFMSMVEEEKRGIFTANKEIISLLTGVIFNFTFGAIIDYFKEKGEMKTAFVLGAVALLLLSVLHTFTLIFTQDKKKVESLPEKYNKSINFLSFLKNKKVLKISLVTLFWYVSYYSTVSFYGTYQIKELGFSLKFISVITIISYIARILVSKFWGVYADKNSFSKMMCRCFVVTAVGHFVMIFTLPSNGKILYTFYLVCTAIGQGGIGSGLINLCYDYIPNRNCSDALAFSQAIGGTAGFLITFLISPLVEYIQKNGNSFLGISVYAQQVISIIALLIEILAIVYIIYVVNPMPRNIVEFNKKER